MGAKVPIHVQHTYSVKINQEKKSKSSHPFFKKSIRNNIICRTIQ